MPWRHMGEWRYSSTFLDLGTRWRWVVSFTPLPLYPRGKSSRYPLDRRLGGPESVSTCIYIEYCIEHLHCIIKSGWLLKWTSSTRRPVALIRQSNCCRGTRRTIRLASSCANMYKGSGKNGWRLLPRKRFHVNVHSMYIGWPTLALTSKFYIVLYHSVIKFCYCRLPNAASRVQSQVRSFSSCDV
jgi:hypothetical protein